MSRPDIVIVVASLPKWISSALAAEGHGVELLYPTDNGRADSGWDSGSAIAAAQRELHPAIIRRRMAFSRNAGPLRLLQLIRLGGLAMRCALRGAGLFILWSAFPVLIFGPPIRLLNRPSLYLVTGLGMHFADRYRGGWRHRLVCGIYRFLFSSPRALVIVHNREDKAELVTATGVAPERVIVTGGCGVDPTLYPYRDCALLGREPVILVPSRLLRDKGIMDAARASAMLSARGVAHRMLFTSNPVAGRGDALSAAELDEAARAPGVEFTGFRDQIRDLYAEADVVCIPSWYREGLQTAILEAAAAGCPVVACDNVGVRDFLRPGMDAVVVPPRDPEALADALVRMLGDAALAERMRASAHARMLAGFTQQHMLETTMRALTPFLTASAGAA
jgi:glycosyltransferase involved in cell wall biosynthesis